MAENWTLHTSPGAPNDPVFVGVGEIKTGRFPERGFVEALTKVAILALKDAGVLRGSIGATSTNSLQVWNGSGTSMLVVDTFGNVTAVANVTAYSDERLKKDWAALDASGDFIANLASVKCGTYSRIDGDARQVGARCARPPAR